MDVPHDAPHPSRKSDCNTVLGKPAFRQHTQGFKSVSYQGSSSLHMICFFTCFSPESPILPSIEIWIHLPQRYSHIFTLLHYGWKILDGKSAFMLPAVLKDLLGWLKATVSQHRIMYRSLLLRFINHPRLLTVRVFTFQINVLAITFSEGLQTRQSFEMTLFR